MEKAIVLKNVTKKYKLYNDTKERILDLITPKEYGKNFYALANVNFEANHGEVIGLIGINGSGKSTLSNIIAGIVPETSGSVQVNGEVSIIAVAAGLKNDLTGRENIELKLLMLGFNKEEIKELEPEIIEFSELENFIDQPVKSYSSGMKSRLGFAISVNVNPDILVIDEALSVGDKAFAEKSFNKMLEFKKEEKTMIFVSHSLSQMKQFCDKLLWLDFGMVKDYGTVDEILPKYEKFLEKWQDMSKSERDAYRSAALEYQQKLLKGEKIEKQLDIDDFYTKKTTNVYIEKPISILGHIRAGESYIYEDPKKTENSIPSSKFKHKVYFIKRQVTYNDETFYLLSEKPSGVKGTVGWMKAADLSLHRHVIVDFDQKKFLIKGVGKAYDRPWGGKKNLVFDDLSQYKGVQFNVVETNLVGSNVWYKGVLGGKEVWIHQNHLVK